MINRDSILLGMVGMLSIGSIGCTYGWLLQNQTGLSADQATVRAEQILAQRYLIAPAQAKLVEIKAPEPDQKAWVFVYHHNHREVSVSVAEKNS